MSNLEADRLTRVARPWRIVFVLYALALTTGTHWPRLELGVADMPAPDKILHMLGFGGLTFLLWRTRWLGGGLLLLGVALLWALLDEITQAIPILGRTFSWLDVIGSSMGVVLVMVWIWALKPTGGRTSRLRLAMNELVIDEMFLRPDVWVKAALAGVCGGLILGAPAAWIVRQLDPSATLAGGLAAAFVGGVAAALAMLDRQWRIQRDVVIERQLCAACGRPCVEAQFDDGGRAVCTHCGNAIHAGQWQLIEPQPAASIRQPAWHAVVTAIGLLSLVLAGYMVMHAGSLHVPWLLHLMDMAAPGRIPADLRLVIDMTVAGIVLAAAVRIYRETQARLVDAQAERCRSCGQNLTETPAPQGIGRCNECGLSFVRLSSSK